MTRKLMLGNKLGLNMMGLMLTSPQAALASVPAPKRDDPPIVQAPRKPRRHNASATRMVFGSKYPGQVMRDVNKAKGVGRPPKKKPVDSGTPIG